MSKAENTRLTILQKAFELIYQKGYLTTSIDDIIATTSTTKGAFYYHFKSKDEMGLAIIHELLKPNLNVGFIEQLKNSGDPCKDIYGMMKYLLLEDPFLKVEYGCPAANFTQEMTPWDKRFSEAIVEITNDWEQALKKCLNTGKKNGLIRKEVKATDVCYFVMSGYWGIRNFGKLHNSKNCYHAYLRELKQYLNSLQIK